jgi:Protein of unknown function (DUF3082)
MKRCHIFVSIVSRCIVLLFLVADAAFLVSPWARDCASPRTRELSPQQGPTSRAATTTFLRVVKDDEGGDGETRILGPLAEKAATGTVNERLMTELQQAAEKEKYGARSNMGKKMGLNSFRSSKTDEERQAAIEEARNLNGVNPVIAFAGSLFALAGATGLWFLTQYLAEFFALHPVESDVYFVARVSYVFRNIVMGFVSLASGFFGVTGMGIFLLAVRVAYGVAMGELDPTPIKKAKKGENEINVSSAWDLMLNKTTKRGRR